MFSEVRIVGSPLSHPLARLDEKWECTVRSAYQWATDVPNGSDSGDALLIHILFVDPDLRSP